MPDLPIKWRATDVGQPFQADPIQNQSDVAVRVRLESLTYRFRFERHAKHDFVRNSWVVAPTRLENELGFRFRYSAEETILEMWNDHQRKKQEAFPSRLFTPTEPVRRAA